ncbi:glycosyltransferase family 39 protein [Allobranchiibius sp. CTAmp26]|uniref:glycosyltransferase family 39 protein n=1 Tax=Allobranchiibius sp. CTAmp26 TaxID=2815214 RepID=UPI001AA0B8AC|nr:glycosyltransferase family 39 protein [Allobranchiibius sp. CTAmp26]MBO1756732.1 glycosyltransferase family 39 protein [Allobranchiibius sp. CTAmp26]
MAAVAAAQLAVLVAFSGGYGYHRDEMYFIVSGAHPAWGYPDQPPLVPLLAWLMNWLDPASLVVLRLPSALACAATTVVASLIAREVGADRRSQLLAAGCTAVSGFALAVGHIVSTTTFDLLCTTVLLWLLLRAARHDGSAAARARNRDLVLAGVTAGVGCQFKPQVALVAVVAVIALTAVGPRTALRSRGFAGGVLAACVVAGPYVLWQASHGWPQLTVAGNVAGSAEGGRVGFLPFQLVMVSPVLVPVWVAGLVAPWRRPDLRTARFIPVTYAALAVAYLIGDGKAYYLASLYPTLLGLGAASIVAWIRRGRSWLRRGSLAVAIAVSALIAAGVALPVTPPRSLQGSAAMALNPDIGEEVGWPRFTTAVAAAWTSIHPARRARTALFTGNYGEASDVNLFGSAHGLPRAYSGHNAYSEWGPPPDRDTSVLLLGYEQSQAAPLFTDCTIQARIDNGDRLENQEQGMPVLLCRVSMPWSTIWRDVRHYD